MAFADSKCLAVEHVLAETEAVRDEALAKAAFLESECKRLAQLIVDNTDKMLGRAFLEKEGLHGELALLKERFVESKKAMTHKRNQRATTQRALVDAKMWRVGEDKRVEAVVARAREGVLKKVRQ